MQEGKADGKLGQQKLGFLDNRGVSAVYSDYRTGNNIFISSLKFFSGLDVELENYLH